MSVPAVVQRPPPWGYLATLGWGLLAVAVSVVAMAVALVPLIAWNRTLLTSDVLALLDDEPMLCLASTASTLALVATVALAARLRRWPAADYLGIVWPRRQETVVALWCLVLLAAACDAVTYLLGRDLVQQYDLDTYLKAKAAGALPLMWFELVVLAPLGEEILFRGFLQQGWVRSPQSLWPATAVIAALWAGLHTQYGLYDIFQIFLMGLLFGWVRWWSGSTLLTMLMHGLANIWYLLEAMAKIEWFS